MKRFALVALVLCLFPQPRNLSVAQETPKVEKYRDAEYGYSFQYPANWQLRKLPEGAANDDVRVSLQAPNGSSFMVIVEKRGQNPTKAEVQSDSERKARVDKLIEQTIQQIYDTVARNLGATESKMGDRTDLSNNTGLKFYVSTLHKMKVGEPVVVAGIHYYPFSKPYSISFMMTAFFDKGAEKDNAIMTAVFNSFKLDKAADLETNSPK
jgi:hypothetical protein